MITWGISANSHDAALAVFSNDGLEFASHSERFSGVKNDAHLNTALIDYAKQWGEPDEVAWFVLFPCWSHIERVMHTKQELFSARPSCVTVD